MQQIIYLIALNVDIDALKHSIKKSCQLQATKFPFIKIK
jgi:hypothetical protein